MNILLYWLNKNQLTYTFFKSSLVPNLILPHEKIWFEKSKAKKLKYFKAWRSCGAMKVDSSITTIHASLENCGEQIVLPLGSLCVLCGKKCEAVYFENWDKNKGTKYKVWKIYINTT